MELKDILETKDKFTKDELEDISSCLLILVTSLTDTIVELKDKSLKASCYDTYLAYEDEISFYNKRLSSVNKLHSSICKFLRNGVNNNEM